MVPTRKGLDLRKMDWREEKLEMRIQHLLESGLVSDFTIRHEGADGKIKDYQVHKLILAMASPVFETMFQNKNFDCETVVINDVDVRTMDFFLQFIYQHTLKFLLVKDAWSLYYLGEKYSIESLKNFCMNYVYKNANVDSICTSYESSKFYGLTSLASTFKQKLKLNFKFLYNKEDFMVLTPESILMLLDETDLDVREVELFEACSKWIENYFKDKDDELVKNLTEAKQDVENIENTRKEVGVQASTPPRSELVQKILSKIFFNDMTPKEFVTVALSGLLTPEESHSIMMNLVDDRKLLDGLFAWPEYFPFGVRKKSCGTPIKVEKQTASHFVFGSK